MASEVVSAESSIEKISMFSALKNSLYPGATDASIMMVLDYCKAAKIDPMLKPVHIVPMTVKDPVTANYVERDVIMPGIGLYRIQAERSGMYAGIGEPQYGPDKTESFGGITVAYPEWCSVTVSKIVQGVKCDFSSGKQFWKENYGSKKGGAPSPIWVKRPYEMLAKCSEAQALRKAFPDIVAQTATAEEMEGRQSIEATAIHAEPTDIKHTGNSIKQKLKSKPPLELKAEIARPAEAEQGVKISAETLEEIQLLIDKLNVNDEQIEKWLTKAQVQTLTDITEKQGNSIIEFLLQKLT